MNRFYILFCSIILVLAFTVSSSLAVPDKEVDNILSSAETLFKMMKEKNYVRIWFFLSHASRTAIIDDTFKNIMSKDQIKKNFETGGTIAQTYWNSYLDAFDPDMVLEKSRWELGKLSKDKALINIIYRKAEKPAIIQMYKEEGSWKVDLAETFKSAKR